MPIEQTAPIALYFWPTPNGQKASIGLEEFGVPYDVHFIDIGRGDQFAPDFLAISPNNRIPAIVDPEGPGGAPISVFESGAILQYLGRKFGRFYPADEQARVQVEEWLYWQVGGVGPMFGQYNHFHNYAPEKIPYAKTRYENEVHRLFGVLERRLTGRDYVAGEYSIADMAIVTWLRDPKARGIDITEFPNVSRWLDAVLARPAVKRALAIKAPVLPANPAVDEKARKILFGQRALKVAS